MNGNPVGNNGGINNIGFDLPGIALEHPQAQQTVIFLGHEFQQVDNAVMHDLMNQAAVNIAAQHNQAMEHHPAVGIVLYNNIALRAQEALAYLQPHQQHVDEPAIENFANFIIAINERILNHPGNFHLPQQDIDNLQDDIQIIQDVLDHPEEDDIALLQDALAHSAQAALNIQQLQPILEDDSSGHTSSEVSSEDGNHQVNVIIDGQIVPLQPGGFNVDELLEWEIPEQPLELENPEQMQWEGENDV